MALKKEYVKDVKMKSNSKKKKNLGQKRNSKDKRVSAKNGNFVKEVKGQDKSKKQGLKTSGLYLKYISEVVPEMMKKFKYKSPMAVPKLEKIVVNTGIGPWLDKGKEIKEDIKKDLGIICGQKPAPTRARKAIAGFKIKIGQEIGAKVVLRKIKMYDFLERLIVEALPRVKDFRGIPESNFGERGEVSFGIKEHVAFAEINSEEVNNVFSLEVSIVNSGNTKKEGLELMKLLGFPISFESEMKEMNNNKLQVEKHKKAVAMKNDK
jgi:large subunit ribosomal protein L5